ncbi:Rsp5p-dependent ubiquitination, sorting of cargo proteins at the multivesicular body [Tulasnella sp. 419]|nr:Rsp5p-dependent ubiquitination, sorting of cargo proteins at the multivesicular body [Tulasnella sp. 419]
MDAVVVVEDEMLQGGNDSQLVVLLPLLIVLSTLLFLLLIFVICVLILRRRRSIVLRESEGPVDLSREDFIDGDGGFEGVESRWLETVSEVERMTYRRAKAYELQYPPNSLPTDITLSQFLSIQEKGVSAWSFDPDYETSPNVLVHARTELTFLPDPSSASSVQSNLPLPKLNEVYYWEVKMFDLPPTTNVSIGLATKPYPSFRLPGHNRYSIAYHSTGDKSYNYPFTAQSFGPALKEGDVLGIGYKPRSGTVFFTRNGRKLDDAFVGLSRWNLFPTIGADGPCSVHVNLGQAGFVHIEANVKKWGLAPSVGTLAPPPAYGSERGSILLEAGGMPNSTGMNTPASRGGRRSIVPGPSPINDDSPSSSGATSPPRRSTRATRRPKTAAPTASSSVPANPSPLRGAPLSPSEETTGSLSLAGRPGDQAVPPRTSTSGRYISPTDAPFHNPRANPRLPPVLPGDAGEEDLESNSSIRQGHTTRDDSSVSPSSTIRSSFIGDEEETPLVTVHAAEEDEVEDPGSPSQIPNPPTPHVSDIHLHPIRSSHHSHSRASSLDTTTSNIGTSRQHQHHIIEDHIDHPNIQAHILDLVHLQLFQHIYVQFQQMQNLRLILLWIHSSIRMASPLIYPQKSLPPH